MQLGYLADHLHFLPQLAEWHHAEWSWLRPGDTVEARIQRTRKGCGHQEIPTTVIAYEGDTLLGSASLVTHDMDTRCDLSPWLAGVYVSAAHRQRGIGAVLVERIVAEARALGLPRLYLYTPGAEAFYAKRGWTPLEHTPYHGATVTIMVHEL